jgi:hypothetical protein
MYCNNPAKDCWHKIFDGSLPLVNSVSGSSGVTMEFLKRLGLVHSLINAAASFLLFVV